VCIYQELKACRLDAGQFVERIASDPKLYRIHLTIAEARFALPLGH
jgi:hypothetical protein